LSDNCAENFRKGYWKRGIYTIAEAAEKSVGFCIFLCCNSRLGIASAIP
jgi:hypothetical protein